MSYRLNDWKPSTVETLRRLEEENKKGNRPKAAFFRNGAIAAWLTLLKNGEYVEYSDGYKITSKGLKLLEDLEINPPKPRRSTRKKKVIKSIEPTKDGKEQFVIAVEGANFTTQFSVYTDSAKMMKALSAFHEEINKS